MGNKLIDAASARPGTTIIVDGIPCVVRSNDISKTGKHGHAKCRIEAISVIDGRKKVVAVAGHERFESPIILKHRAQVLSINENKASVMDMESFETLEMVIPEDLKEEIKENDQVEYWNVEGSNIIKRKA